MAGSELIRDPCGEITLAHTDLDRKRSVLFPIGRKVVRVNAAITRARLVKSFETGKSRILDVFERCRWRPHFLVLRIILTDISPVPIDR